MAYYQRNPRGEPCSVEGCPNKWSVAKMCNMHYQRKRTTGSVEKEGYGILPSRSDNREAWIKESMKRDTDECYSWPFHVNKDGRSSVQVGKTRMNASRYVCILKNGPPPSPKHDAAHSCGNGNRNCLNHNHLRWATKKENQADRVLHGTVVNGTKTHNAVLTEEKVVWLREQFDAGVHKKIIAAALGVSLGCVYRAGSRQTWAWLP